MAKRYSRLKKTQKRKNTRNAFLFILLSISMVAFFIFVGMPLLIKYTSFVSDIRKSSEPIARNDTTPPPPPRINPVPNAINQDEIEVSGSTEPGAIVKILYNSNEKELVANSDGNFSTTLKLSQGDNKIRFYAVDSSGNESQKTQGYVVSFDKEPPELTIDSPENGKNFYGNSQRQISIKGVTEKDSNMNINGRFVRVDEEGNFNYSTTLSEGENKFIIVSVDEAGNKTEQELTVNYTP